VKYLLRTLPLLLAVALLAPGAQAKDDKKTAERVVTVYVSAHGGSAMAKKMNESHAKMEAEGWRFADFEIHTENADTEGALITYVK
jgi:predicted secreted Zn-dependent protease